MVHMPSAHRFHLRLGAADSELVSCRLCRVVLVAEQYEEHCGSADHRRQSTFLFRLFLFFDLTVLLTAIRWKTKRR